VKIQIVEMSPRDGLQNEKKILTASTKVQLIAKLVDAGVRRIEVGSFVSADWVPQMATTTQVCRSLQKLSMPKGQRMGVLVPNLKGLESAIDCGVREIAVFTAASESFTKKNINCTINESFERFQPVIALSKRKKLKIRGYVSTAFYCPYEGKITPKAVIKVVEKLADMGIEEISVGDTIGAATPGEVRQLLKPLVKVVRPSRLAMHMHDTRGTALANILEALNFDIGIFDSSLGGAGGCPYAPGAAGNVATEDLVYLFNGLGLETGIALNRLIAANGWLASRLQRELPSRLGRVGIPHPL
jgi:hydroxymethylglutaryl-CoA lyase